MAQVNFGPKSEHRILKSKNGMVFKFKTFCTQASSSRTIDELDRDRVMLLRARRAVHGRGVSPWPAYCRLGRVWALQGPREAHSARASPWIRTRRLQQQPIGHRAGLRCFIVSNTRSQGRLARTHSARKQSARGHALGSDARCSALGMSPRGARPQEDLVSTRARISACTVYPFFRIGGLLPFANFTA